MFQKVLVLVLFFVVFGFITNGTASAIEDPLKRPNNKMGIHILFDSELPKASQFINSSGGDWGYVIIPIQSNDKDIIKWQKFMDECKKKRVIPIIRLATEGDYFNTQVWRKPTFEDVIDFANFLDSLQWPTKNRYVVVFNEVNRFDEWGGKVDPGEYAEILGYAVTVFKSKNPDYFIINAGLDNAAPREGTKYMNQYDYIVHMNEAVPGIFNQIDGWSSHSYPNPGFSQAPNANSSMGVGSFMHEKNLIKTMSHKDLPVFITETGWTTDKVPDDKIAQYYQQTWNSIWSDPSIVAITPFLLQANGGPFKQFTMIKDDGNFTKQYEALKSLPKRAGFPTVYKPKRVLAAHTQTILANIPPETRNFNAPEEPKKKKMLSVVDAMKGAFSWIIGK